MSRILRICTIAILAVPAVAVALAGAESAEVVYRSSRPALKLELTKKGHRFTDAKFEITVHCSNRSGVGIISGFRNPIPINPQTGRFVARNSSSSSDSASDFRLKGTVHRQVVRGFIFVKSSGPGAPKCHSGRPNDPWVKFAARR